MPQRMYRMDPNPEDDLANAMHLEAKIGEESI